MPQKRRRRDVATDQSRFKEIRGSLKRPTPMSRLVKPWLASFDWEIVTEINRGLCKQKNALHKPTSDGHLPAKTLGRKINPRNSP